MLYCHQDMLKGDRTVNVFDNSELEKHTAEVQDKWGQTPAYQEYTQRTKNYSKQNWNTLADGMELIMAEFAVCMTNCSSDSNAAQNLVRKLQSHITENYYRCTDEILAGLGQVYIADERFKNNIDKHADGTAMFICDAIKHYCGE